MTTVSRTVSSNEKLLPHQTEKDRKGLMKRAKEIATARGIMRTPHLVPHAYGPGHKHYLVRKLEIIEAVIQDPSLMQYEANRSYVTIKTIRQWIRDFTQGKKKGRWESLYHHNWRSTYRHYGTIPPKNKRPAKQVFESRAEVDRGRAEVLANIWGGWHRQENAVARWITEQCQVEFVAIFQRFVERQATKTSYNAKDPIVACEDLIGVGIAETIVNMHRWAKLHSHDDKNFSISTARRAITSAMVERHHHLERNVKIPSEIMSGAYKLARSLHNKGANVSDECAIQEFMEDAIASGNYSARRLEQVLEYRTLIQEHTLSIVENYEEEGTFLTRITEENQHSFDNLGEFMERVFQQMIKNKRISSRDADWTKRRHGFGKYMGVVETFEEIGQRSGVCRERVRQACKRVLSRLQERLRILGIQKSTELLT